MLLTAQYIAYIQYIAAYDVIVKQVLVVGSLQKSARDTIIGTVVGMVVQVYYTLLYISFYSHSRMNVNLLYVYNNEKMYSCVCNRDTRRFITFSLIVKYVSPFIEGSTENHGFKYKCHCSFITMSQPIDSIFPLEFFE